jgi:lysozyme
VFVSNVGVNLIKHFEGFRANKYVCQAGYDTIGYGHKLKKGEDFDIIDIMEAERILNLDLIDVCRGVNRLTHVSLRQNQYDAVVSFVFNLGLGAYQRSTLRTKINREEHDLAMQEFNRWIYIGVRKSVGLIKRRKAESLLYNSCLDY